MARVGIACKALLLIFIASGIFGCASTKVVNHTAKVEVYVFATERGWERAKDIAWKSGDRVTLVREKYELCIYEKGRDLHQCLYYFSYPKKNYCESAKSLIESKLKVHLSQRISYSTCLPTGELNFSGSPPKETGIALIFDSTVNFTLLYEKSYIGTACADGKVSRSTRKGTCSWHGGASGIASTWRLLNSQGEPFVDAYAFPE